MAMAKVTSGKGKCQPLKRLWNEQLERHRNMNIEDQHHQFAHPENGKRKKIRSSSAQRGFVNCGRNYQVHLLTFSEATHAVDYNPIDHDRRDEMISGWSSDDDDYSTVDLSQIRKDNDHGTTIVPVRRRAFQDAHYEPSLDVVDHA
ncbi:hypothetical protein OSTOST_21210 [Ostertagia ostertagi]